MGLPSPLVLINGQPQVDGYNATAGEVVTVSLASNAGVFGWSLSCIGTDDFNTAAAVNATLNINAATNVATFTVPNTYGCALIFKSTVNNGQDVNGLVQHAYTTTFGVYTFTTTGFRLGGQNETTEGDSIYGWLSKFNDIVRSSLITTNPGALTNGYVLTVQAPSVVGYVPLDLSGVGTYLSGVLSISHLPNLLGDVVGPITNNTLTLAGDVTGRAGVTVVQKINGASVPASGSFTTGNVLQAHGYATLEYAPINVGGGSNFITGQLPLANIAPGIFGMSLTQPNAYSGGIGLNNLFGNYTGSIYSGGVTATTEYISIPTTGPYRVSLTVTAYVNEVDPSFYIYKNTTLVATGAWITTSTTPQTVTIEAIINATAGDQILPHYSLTGSGTITVVYAAVFVYYLI